MKFGGVLPSTGTYPAASPELRMPRLGMKAVSACRRLRRFHGMCSSSMLAWETTGPAAFEPGFMATVSHRDRAGMPSYISVCTVTRKSG